MEGWRERLRSGRGPASRREPSGPRRAEPPGPHRQQERQQHRGLHQGRPQHRGWEEREMLLPRGNRELFWLYSHHKPSNTETGGKQNSVRSRIRGKTNIFGKNSPQNQRGRLKPPFHHLEPPRGAGIETQQPSQKYLMEIIMFHILS